jgi:hypothetical protein
MEEVSENVTADADGDGKAARFVICIRDMIAANRHIRECFKRHRLYAAA